MRPFYCCVLLLMSKLGLAQGPIDFHSLVNKTHTERTVALLDYYGSTVRYQDSTSTFDDMAAIQRLSEQYADKELSLEAELIELHYYAYRYDQRLPELAKMTNLLIDKARKEEKPWLEVRCESLIATRYYENQQYEASFKRMSKAVELLQNEDPAEYPIKHICLYLLGNIHYDFQEYQAAIAMFRAGVEATSQFDVYYYQMHTLNSLGMAYRNINELDSSNLWFGQVLEKAVQQQDTAWLRLTEGNLGENHYLMGNDAEAIPLIRSDLSEARRTGGPGRISNCLYLLADIAIRQGDLKLAEGFINEALQKAQLSGETKRLKAVYPVAARFWEAKQQPALVRLYMDSAMMATKAVELEFDRLLLMRAQQKLELERMATATAQLEGERKVQLFSRNVVIAAMVLMLLAVLLVFHRHRLKQERLRSIILREKEQAEDALHSAKQRLDEFVEAIQQKNEELQQVHALLNSIKTEGHDEQQHRLNNAVILTDQDWRDFMELFEVLHPGFLARLGQQFPELTLSQIRFFALCRLERTNKEMASMLGVTTDAIRQMRSRLRKQLQMPEGRTIVAMALSI